jgi:hypothetical protein
VAGGGRGASGGDAIDSEAEIIESRIVTSVGCTFVNEGNWLMVRHIGVIYASLSLSLSLSLPHSLTLALRNHLAAQVVDSLDATHRWRSDCP